MRFIVRLCRYVLRQYGMYGTKITKIDFFFRAACFAKYCLIYFTLLKRVRTFLTALLIISLNEVFGNTF